MDSVSSPTCNRSRRAMTNTIVARRADALRLSHDGTKP